MSLYTTILVALFGVLALWSLILAGVATKTATLLADGPTRYTDWKNFYNGAGLLAFDGFLTFFLATGLAIWYATGRTLAPLIVLPIIAVLFILWLAGAAAYSHGFDIFNYSDCEASVCNTLKATVAFAWLGWLTLLALLVLAVLLVVKPPADHADATGHSGFSLNRLRKNKKTTDVEKAQAPQQEPVGVSPAPVPSSTQANHDATVPPSGAHNANVEPDQAPPSAFAGAHGAPEGQQQSQPASYDPAQAYAQQSYYGQQPASDPTAMPQAPGPQAPTGWSVSPLGTQPTDGAAPTAEIVAHKPENQI
ncbi:unnamed protein product [Tilletia controversa]|uniref:MARVEL domain-containing protein n=3 Tax=Tilletia TaxID=13289 RepID=A0A8X7SVJ0_9BASI|nr:hypothetical protein CF336_g6850 [Tilletia laevis]KAE8188798.1 hypothetical protein CF328_g6489 [Tilletia controversa]KAE8252273.1 hypothetical protein A4X03_0g6211 [Tilletia caries]KAE8190827.1 hypothetical protein CF335_g6255 [Tilletia laevis]KAE8245559.1 hypothetical protein A4X06_0g5598 [Tilletia controversa]